MWGGAVKPPIVNERRPPQQQDQLRGKEASPSQVVTADGTRTQEGADEETRHDQRPGSQFVGTGLNVAALKLPQAQNTDGEKEPEFQRIVEGQEDGVGDGHREWR